MASKEHETQGFVPVDEDTQDIEYPGTGMTSRPHTTVQELVPSPRTLKGTAEAHHAYAGTQRGNLVYLNAASGLSTGPNVSGLELGPGNVRLSCRGHW